MTVLLTGLFRQPLEKVLKRSDRARGSRSLFDVVMMFKNLLPQVLYNPSNDHTELEISDRLSFMQFRGLSLEDNALDAKTIWLYQQHLVEARTINKLFARCMRN